VPRLILHVSALSIALGLLFFAGCARPPAYNVVIRHGTIYDGTGAAGRGADLAILDAPSHLHLAYRPGVPLIRTVLLDGEPT